MRLRGAAAVALAAAAGLAWLLASSARLPDIELRTIPWTTAHGLVWRAFAPGQGFTCRRDGLRRIDVAFARLKPEDAALPELVLREGGPGGAELRRAPGRWETGEREAWARFEFEPLAVSAGRALHFQLVPAEGDLLADSTPFVRFRGAASPGRPWGDRVVGAELLEGEILSEDPGLRGIALAMEGVDAAAGPVELELWHAGEAGGEPLRAARLAPSAPLARGWALFAFEPIEDSRWRRLRYRLRAPAGVQPVGDERGLSYWTFHGSDEVDPRLGPVTIGGETLHDRDLIFRAWSDPPRLEALRLARERAGWRLPVAAALWVLAMAAFVALLPRR